MDDIAIKVENLSKIYKLYDKPVDRLKESINPFRKKYHKDFYALENVNFEVKKGDTVGIIGKNGSGKSTLLKIITGVLTQSAGCVQVNGKVSALLELGAGFNMEFTGIENIYLNGTIMGYSKEEMNSKLQDILDFADIGDFIYQPVKIYSSGMFVRLAFAVAISVEPEILIVDEALAVGDVRFQAKCYSRFDSLKKNEKTILFVSHSTETIKTYCDKAILIENGLIISEGNTRVIVDMYIKRLRNVEIEKHVNRVTHTEILSNMYEMPLTKVEESIWYNKNENKYGTDDANFVRVGIFDEHGNSVQQFENGSMMEFVFQINVFEDIDRAYFGIGFRNVQGQDLLIFNGTENYDNFVMNDLKKGSTFRIRVKCKASLVPSDYFITVALSKMIDGNIVNCQIRYDFILIKIVGCGRLYAGVFVEDSLQVDLI